MLKDFNLLISTSRGNERNACSEAWYLLREVGDARAQADVTGILGLVAAKTSLDPASAIQLLRKLLIDRPWEFRYILKVTPLYTLTESSLEAFTREAKRLREFIMEDEAFKVMVNKRRSELRTREIIEAIAPHIDRKVDLENPDRIILVEVIGDISGISLVEADGILSVEREKRRL